MDYFKLLVAVLMLTQGVISAPSSSKREESSSKSSSSSEEEGRPCTGNNGRKQPNILMILLDDLGWNDVSYHNSPDIRTPNIDALANDGIKLENHYVQPICTPSRATLLTGLHEIHTGLQHDVIHAVQRNGMPLELPTLPEKLRDQGYATHMIGKWHLGHYSYDYMPTHRGFDTFLGIVQALGNHTSYSACEYFPLPPNPNAPSWYFCGKDLRWGDSAYDISTAGIYSTDLFAQRAIKIASDHARLSPNKPLFVELSFSTPHYPLQAPDSYINQYRSTIQDPNRLLYAAMMSHVDDAIKSVVDAWTAAGLYENTILIFMSDNGGENHWGGNSFPFRGNKQSTWEAAFKSVTFVNSPLLNRNDRGTVSNAFLHISDWYPTLVNLAGGDTTGQQLDGFDIWDVITKGRQNPRTELLHLMDPLIPPRGVKIPDSPWDNRYMAALRVGDWKIITGNPSIAPIDNNWFVSPAQIPNVTIQRQVGGFDFITGYVQRQPGYVIRASTDPPTKNLWLFNIANDPYEENDLSASQPEVVSLLLSRLAWYNSTAVPCRYPPQDLAGDPTLFGGFWTPWVSSTGGSSVY